jgi:peptidoglycan/xylan/chitin deacetylase (PgdA/CDA1 family)
VPRLLRIFEAAGVKQTFFIPGWCADRYPDIAAAIAREGHELGLHGYLHESIEHRSRRTERDLLTAGIEALSQITHERPKGWRGPGYRFSPYTADLLAEAGFVYDSSLMGDDVPYLLHAAKGDLIELPVDWANDDWPQYVYSSDFGVEMPIRAPERALEVYRAEIHAARRHGGLWIAVWHPFVSGRLARAEALAILLDELLELGDVWVAPLAAIADHIRHVIDDRQYVPRTEALPLYRQRVTGARKRGRGRETPTDG